MYETFEHTADLGLRIRAADLDTLFAEAAEALFATIVEDIKAIEPANASMSSLLRKTSTICCSIGCDELLYRFDGEKLVFGCFDVLLHDGGLTGTAWGEPFDPEKHVLNHEVKAITYHDLSLLKVKGEWIAEVIVDI